MAVSHKNVRLALTIDKETAKEVEDMAKKETRTTSVMLSILIKEALKERKKK